MKTSIALLTAGLALAAHGALQAQSGRSLGDARSDVIHGNGPGITLIPARPKAAAPGTPASPSTSASASAPQGKTTGTAAPAGTWGAPATSTTASTSTSAAASPGNDTPSAADRLNNLFRSGEPLSGQPMNAATRNDPPGIVLPTGRDKK